MVATWGRDDTATDLWSLRNREDLRIRQWEESGVVFDPDTGETHLLSRLACEILNLLKAGEFSTEGLAARLANANGVACDPELTTATQTALRSLAEAGLLVHDVT